MNSFYLFTISVILCCAGLGYAIGAIRIIAMLIKISVASLVTWMLFEYGGNLLLDYFTIEPLWAYVSASLGIFIIVLTIMHLILRLMINCVQPVNKNWINRSGGSITGICIGIAGILFAAQYSSLNLPAEVSEYMNQAGVDKLMEEPVQLVTDKLNSLPVHEAMQVMAVKTTGEFGEVKEEGVRLSFSTNSYTFRPELEMKMLQLINAERNKSGSASLTLDTSLIKAARMHSIDMLARGYFSHNTPEGVDPFQRLHNLKINYRYAGENLALAPTLLNAHAGLMKSPGHRTNILNRSYGRAGIGVIDAGVYGLMITQEFRD